MKIKTKLGWVEPPRWEPPDEHEETFLKFAESRQLEPDFLASLGVHVCPDDGDRPGWIAIPYPHLSGVWHTRYRNPGDDVGPKYWAASGSGTHLYNPGHFGPNADEIWFTEGEIDCMTLFGAGFPAVGVPGVGIAKQIFSGPWRLLFNSANVIVAFDNDEAGRSEGVKLAQAFAPRSFIFDEYPADINDVNEWWVLDPEGMLDAFHAFKEGNGL